MNRYKILLLALIAFFSLSANAEFTTIARAHEVALSDFSAPASPNGMAGFRSCADCKRMNVRVTPETRYVLNRRDVTLRQFRDALAAVTDRDAPTVVVLHHLESDVVLRISTDL